MRALVTDAEFADLSLERDVLEAAGFTVEVAQCRTPEEVIAAGAGVAAMVVQYAPITAEVLDALDDLRVVSRYGVGVDNVDLDAARRRGVWVANVPNYGTEEVGTHTVALLLSLLRHVPFHDRRVRDGVWDYQASGRVRRLSTMTLGLVGCGRIGRAVAGMVGGWFARVVGYDPHLPEEAWPEGVERVELGELFATSHAISLHLPLTEETHDLVSRPLLEQTVDGGAYLVNTARGGLVAPDDALWALEEGRLRGVGLDVMPTEPPEPHPLLTHPRALVTPHAAWNSEESEVELRRLTAENVVAWHRDGHPRTFVVEGRSR